MENCDKPWPQYFHARQYQMLMNGDLNSLRDEIETNPNFALANLVWQPDDNSALHIAASAGQLNLAVAIFDIENELLYRKNCQGDLPLHVAAKAGHEIVVRKLVQLGGEDQLKMGNSEGNTAIHIALENKQLGLGQFLFRKCPDTFYQLNGEGICPLYLAIEDGFWEIVKEMVDAVVEKPHLVENALRETSSSVLHAAIRARDIGLITKMVRKYPDVLFSFDEWGRSPLSYAADTEFVLGVTYFLRKCPYQAFEPDMDNSFPIHKACGRGNVAVVREFLTQSPNTKFLLNSKGQNILHIAASSGRTEVVEYLLGHKGIDRLMINKKDDDGNTPLHLAVIAKRPRVVSVLICSGKSDPKLQNKRCVTPFHLAGDSSYEQIVNRFALQHANLLQSPQIRGKQEMGGTKEWATQQEKSPLLPLHGDGPSSTPDSTNRNMNTLLVVSTLIATITFAAGFTVPGDHHSLGTPTVARRLAFRVFLLSNTIALCCSILASMALLWTFHANFKNHLRLLKVALPSLAIALCMMFVAFLAALVVHLLGIFDWVTCGLIVLGCVFLPLFLGFLFYLFFSISSDNKLVRFTFRAMLRFMLLACDVRRNRMSLP